MEKANRKRSKAITLRMTDDEHTLFRNKVAASGLTQQEYFTRLVHGSAIPSENSIRELKKLNDTVSDLDRQVRGMAINVNQMARIANGTGVVPNEKKLAEIFSEVCRFRKEITDIWQSIRSLIQGK